MKLKIALLALAATASLPALAADNNQRGSYIGVDLGSTQFKVSGAGSERKLTLGGTFGYQFNEYVALENQIQRLGSWKVGNGIRVNADTISLSLIGKYPVSQDFSLYGRLGAARNTVSVGYTNLSIAASQTKAVLGLGGEYRLDKNFRVRAELTSLGSNQLGDRSLGVDPIKIKLQQLTLGVQYAF